MFHSSNIKLVALAIVYVLHVGFFDALMDSNVLGLVNSSLSASGKQQPLQNSPNAPTSYRLLTKHDKAKDARLSIPNTVNFVPGAFAVLVKQHIQLPQFRAFAHLSNSSVGLYQLFRVFLI